jgi:hypothetical protein
LRYREILVQVSIFLANPISKLLWASQKNSKDDQKILYIKEINPKLRLITQLLSQTPPQALSQSPEQPFTQPTAQPTFKLCFSLLQRRGSSSALSPSLLTLIPKKIASLSDCDFPKEVPTTISEPTIAENILKLRVSYLGSSEQKNFFLVSNLELVKVVNDLYVQMILYHQHDETCVEKKDHFIQIDLRDPHYGPPRYIQILTLENETLKEVCTIQNTSKASLRTHASPDLSPRSSSSSSPQNRSRSSSFSNANVNVLLSSSFESPKSLPVSQIPSPKESPKRLPATAPSTPKDSPKRLPASLPTSPSGSGNDLSKP